MGKGLLSRDLCLYHPFELSIADPLPWHPFLLSSNLTRPMESSVTTAKEDA